MNKSNLRILHVYRSLLRKMGGPATSVPSLCRGLSQANCSVSILTLDYDDNDIEDHGTSKLIKYIGLNNISGLVKESHIVHIHGVWPLLNNKIMKFCRYNDIKYVISPRASLMLSDINKTYIKIFKKYAAWKFFVKNNIESASGFHVTATNEFDDLKRVGFENNVSIIPNGININEYSENIDKHILYSLVPEIEHKRTLLFFSRIAPKKGLFLLAHAWGKLSTANPAWHLLIVGPDNENHWPEVKTILDVYDPHSYTRCDYLTGDARIAVLKHADIFVLPTYWENFGIVIAEALMAGTPVITTTKTPWNDLQSIGCGWLIEPTVDALVCVLTKAMKHDPQTLQEMGQKGRAYVSKHFDCRNIAADMIKYYEYILGAGDKPEFVYQLEGNGKPSLPIRKPGFLSELAQI